MLITPRKGKIITDRRIVDPIFMFVGAGGFCVGGRKRRRRGPEGCYANKTKFTLLFVILPFGRQAKGNRPLNHE
jgi:hypothetical protein